MNRNGYMRRRGGAQGFRADSQALFRPVVQFRLPSAMHSAENRAAARAAVLDWAKNDRRGTRNWGEMVPPDAYAGTAFDSSGEQVQLGASTDAAGKLWHFQAQHVDPRTGAHWRLQAFVADHQQRDELGVRVFCKPVEPQGFVQSSTPSLIKTFVQQHALLDSGFAVRPSFRSANNEEVYQEFMNLALDSGRKLPVVVVSALNSHQAGESYVVDPEALARQLQGLAHVVALPFEQGFWLTDDLGRELGVFRGSVRIYMPGFHAHAEPRDHPLYIGDKITEEKGRSSFDQRLARRLRALTVQPELLADWPAVADGVSRAGILGGLRKVWDTFAS